MVQDIYSQPKPLKNLLTIRLTLSLSFKLILLFIASPGNQSNYF